MDLEHRNHVIISRSNGKIVSFLRAIKYSIIIAEAKIKEIIYINGKIYDSSLNMWANGIPLKINKHS